MAKDIDALLEQQADQMTSVLKSHAAHIESMLAQHRFQVAQLALHNSPEPFVREVFNHLRDRLVQVTIPFQWLIRGRVGFATTSKTAALFSRITGLK